MADSPQQPAATPPKGEAQPSPAGNGAQAPKKSLDDFLREFAQQSKPAPTQQPAAAAPQAPAQSNETPVTADALRGVINYVQKAADRDARAELDSEIGDAVKTVKSVEGLENASDEVVEGLLHRQAHKDERFRAVWEKRYDDPDTYQRALTALGKDIAKTVNDRPDARLTGDRAAVRAAVAGQSDQVSYGNPSDPQDEQTVVESLDRMTIPERIAYAEGRGQLKT